MLVNSAAFKGLCAYCVSGRVCICGDTHETRAPIDLPATSKEDPMAMEMKEFEYMVGGIPTTALLTEKMAKRLGAKPVGEHSGDPEFNKTAERMSTHGRESDDAGVDATYADGTTSADAITKARTARNKRAS